MSVDGLRVLIGDPALIRELDRLLAVMPRKPVDAVSRLPVALEDFAKLDLRKGFAHPQLGPWVAGYRATCTGRLHVFGSLARFGATDVLVRLSEHATARVRDGAFESLIRVDKTSAVVATLVRGAGDSSARVRTQAIQQLADVPDARTRLEEARDAATGAIRKRLDDAIETLAPADVHASDDVALLRELVGVWAQTFDPEVAALVDLAASRLPSEPITGRSASEREQRWHAIADSRAAEQVGALLATPWPTHWRDASARLEALAGWHDPRIGRGLVPAIETSPYESGASARFDRKLLALVSSLPDRRLLDTCIADAPKLAKTLARNRVKPLGTLAPIVERAKAALAGDVIRRRATAATEAELLAAVYASPDSDEPRLVYADFLLERGDARGELIALQCARGRGEPQTAAVKRRERALLERHAAAIVAPLEPYLADRGYWVERGFVETCCVEAAAFERGAREPAWATVRELAFDAAPSREMLAKLLRARPGVRGLHGVDANQLDELDLSRIESLGVRVTDAALLGRELPALRELAVIADWAAWDGAAAEAIAHEAGKRRLQELAANAGFEHATRWFASTVPKVVLMSTATELALYPVGWSVTIERRPSKPRLVTVELHDAGFDDTPIPWLQQLPPGSVELAVEKTPALARWPAVRKQLDELSRAMATPRTART